VRVLFSFVGGTGHAEPLVPVAEAVRAAGHRVAFTGHERYLPPLASRGFRTFAADGGSGGPPPAGRLPLIEPSQQNEDRVIREYYLGEVPHRRAPGYAELYAGWRPDLVVRDEMDVGAAVLAEAHGLPHVVVLVFAAGSFLRPAVVAEPLAVLRAEHGLPPDPETSTSLHGDLVLSPFPAGFRDPAFPLPATAHLFRVADPARPDPARPDPDSISSWWDGLPDRPVVFVTLGTIFALESGDLFERLLAGLAELPVEVIATVGRDLDPAELGPQPANVHLERWLPPALVLPRAALVVSHGGSGTVAAAVAHGLPQLAVAMGADQLQNAGRIEDLGIGRSLHPMTCTPAQVRDTAAALLVDLRARRGARRLQAEMAALPGADALVPVLEGLARDQSG
jgi:UDP:flavonoid glycosyltransferase YjiC (YdhE family)